MDRFGPKSELALSGALMSAPVWVTWAYYADVLFSMVAAFCGMLVGIHMVRKYYGAQVAALFRPFRRG